MATPNIHLYTAQTPNGIKISILLEELGLPYTTHKIDITKNEQKTPEFLEINPNGRIPALTDTFNDGKQIRLFESASIMLYLVSEYDKEHKFTFPPGTRDFYEMNSWLNFLTAGVGPMQGQANHFTRYAPEHIEYGVNRYQNETRRLYGVLDKHLKDSNQEYLVGNKCTIADFAHWGWISAGGWAGIDIDKFPQLKAWEERMWARPALKKGANVPDPYKIKELLGNKEEVERIMQESKAWIQQGMKEDAEASKK
ncbi:hypothetical protein AAFC00_004619 [Neodothiora populina]|uniref:Glutathione S-transferase n=1 Tax=Neodothiora populina TaxID=2781224 RepID=A0ABR3P2L9_9PEZI